MIRFLIVIMLLPFTSHAVEFAQLSKVVSAISTEHSPITHDLKIKLSKGKSDNENLLVILHGMGSDNRHGAVLQTYGDIPQHLLCFDFPDAGIGVKHDARYTTFGTIYEILPVLFVLKKLVIDGDIKSIDLYGFSAGGGALVNTISILNSDTYDAELKTLGILKQEKRAILKALHNGTILLDCSLKSMKEIVDFRGHDKALDMTTNRYQLNRFEPIEALKKWEGLSLNVIVYFEVPDEVLSNRDDALFIERLRLYNKAGRVLSLSGSNGGHAAYHKMLWKSYISEH